MNSFYNNRPNGYPESIQDGINKLKKALDEADAVIIGAGISTSTAT